MPTRPISQDSTAVLSAATVFPVVTGAANEQTTLAAIFADRVKSSAGVPTTAQFPAGTWGIHVNTSSGAVNVVYNHGGTLKLGALS